MACGPTDRGGVIPVPYLNNLTLFEYLHGSDWFIVVKTYQAKRQ